VSISQLHKLVPSTVNRNRAVLAIETKLREHLNDGEVVRKFRSDAAKEASSPKKALELFGGEGVCIFTARIMLLVSILFSRTMSDDTTMWT
jgi:hypothetical protein